MTLNRKHIFVFGSNEAGRHGKGSALEARLKHGAIYGQGEGLQGNSYGIPTKDKNIQTLPLSDVEAGVKRFLKFAAAHPDLDFNVVKIGTMLAGYKDEQIAPFFRERSSNVHIHPDWIKLLANARPIMASLSFGMGGDIMSNQQKCTVVNVRSGKPYTHYMGRPGKGQKGPFGNPYIVGVHGIRGECVVLFEKWLKEAKDPKAIAYLELVRNIIKPGDVLACFCDDRPCHAWVIADYVNNGYKW